MATSGTVSSLQSGGTGVATGCRFNQSNDTGGFFTGGILGGSGAAQTYYDCIFDNSFNCSSSAGISITVKLFNTRIGGAIVVGSLVDFTWDGGELGTSGSLTVSGATTRSSVSAVLRGNITISANTAGYDQIIHNTAGVGGNVTVSATANNVSVTGDWGSVLFSGVATGMRRFNGAASALDFTGPGYATVNKYTAGSSTAVDLRGLGVTCFAELQAGSAIRGRSLTDSVIVAGYGVASTFSLDASSSRNVCVLGGTHQAGWGGTTDSGTNNRIITETEDTIVSGSSSTLINLIQSIAGAGTSETTPDNFGVEYVAGPPGTNGTNGAAGKDGVPGPPTDVWETTPDYPAIEYIPGPPGTNGVNGAPGATLSYPAPLEDYEVADMVQRILGDPPGPPAVPPAGVVPGTILATTQYAPVGAATFNFVKTTITELDTTNLTITFNAPRNGIVDIVVSTVLQCVPSATVATSAFLALFDHTSHAVVGNPTECIGQPTDNVTTVSYVTVTFHLTGLSEGSHTLDVAGGSTTGAGTVSAFAQANSSKTVVSDAIGPFIIQARASV